MPRLSPAAARRLDAWDADPYTPLSTAIAIVDGPMPDRESLTDDFGGRLAAAPHFTQWVRREPWNLLPPAWVDDPSFDPSRHIRVVALKGAGGDTALFRFVSAATRQQLPRDRPLWRCWVAADPHLDRWAVVLTMHPCLGDDAAAVRILSGLTDGAPPAPAASGPDARVWSQTVTHAVDGVARLLDGLLPGGAPPAPPAPRRHRFSAVSVPVSSVAAVCRTFDVTVDGVALAAVTASFRAELLRRGVTPHRDSLRISGAVSALPVDQMDRVAQLLTVRRRLAGADGSFRPQAALMTALELVPQPVRARAGRLIDGLSRRPVVTVTIHDCGPRWTSRLMGGDLIRLLPVPAVAPHCRTAIAVVADGDDVVFGISGDGSRSPDVDRLASGIEKALSCLVAAARRPRSGRPALATIHPSVANE